MVVVNEKEMVMLNEKCRSQHPVHIYMWGMDSLVHGSSKYRTELTLPPVKAICCIL